MCPPPGRPPGLLAISALQSAAVACVHASLCVELQKCRISCCAEAVHVCLYARRPVTDCISDRSRYDEDGEEDAAPEPSPAVHPPAPGTAAHPEAAEAAEPSAEEEEFREDEGALKTERGGGNGRPWLRKWMK